MMKEFEQAELAFKESQENNPAATRHLTAENLSKVNDFLILDNSLRETTVGTPRGHTLEEKHQIVEAIADTGLKEIILGSFGSKIAVDSQIAEYWGKLGKSFDNTWGFAEVFDMESFDEEPLWTETERFVRDLPRCGSTKFWTPPANPLTTYSKDDKSLFLKASEGFAKSNTAFPAEKQLGRTVLKKSEASQGRIPLGLLMLAGYGIKNAIIELDTSLETFDYQKYDVVERCKFLIRWCKENLPKRDKIANGEDNSARVLVNLRDFTNLERSPGGLEECLRLVDALSRLPPNERPFGFMMEEPTNFIFPDRIGRLCRMVRLTMERAGFPQGRFLVHAHWYFGLGECTQLTCLANGCDGVWAAVCKTGAQTGHACSTVTAVNLLRAGQTEVSKKYNLEKMCVAARKVTAICTRSPCPSHEEVYGELAFDIPYIMTSLPACRYNFALFLKHLGIKQRMYRINELSNTSTIRRAMEWLFGPPDEGGWDPKYVGRMHTAIFEHLLTGLSRDYNTALGLGHLYGLVSESQLSSKMIGIMAKQSPISDYHPTVLEFIQRWNRLCAAYEGVELPPHEQELSNSIMVWNTNVTVEPHLQEIPFRFFISDVVKNSVIDPFPQIFKSSVVRLLTQNEQRIQRTKKEPMMNFFETVLRLKLFIMEASSLGVLPTVDDFALRKNHDFFFGEDVLWLRKVRGKRPKIANNILRVHMDMTPKFYAKKGNNAVVRCVRSAAKRIDENKGIREDLGKAMRRESATKAMQSALTCQVAGAVDFGELEGSSMSISREDFRKIKMIAGMWEGTGGRDSDLDSTQSTPRSLNFPEEMTVELEEAIEDMRNETETRNDPLVAANRAYRSAMVVSLGEFLGSSELNVVDEEFTDNC